MSDDLICARCDQPIAFRELYHQATRAARLESADGDQTVIVAGETVVVHDYPCPTRIEIIDGRVVMNGHDIGPYEQYAPTSLPVEIPALLRPDQGGSGV